MKLFIKRYPAEMSIYQAVPAGLSTFLPRIIKQIQQLPSQGARHLTNYHHLLPSTYQAPPAPWQKAFTKQYQALYPLGKPAKNS